VSKYVFRFSTVTSGGMTFPVAEFARIQF